MHVCTIYYIYIILVLIIYYYATTSVSPMEIFAENLPRFALAFALKFIEIHRIVEIRWDTLRFFYID